MSILVCVRTWMSYFVSKVFSNILSILFRNSIWTGASELRNTADSDRNLSHDRAVTVLRKNFSAKHQISMCLQRYRLRICECRWSHLWRRPVATIVEPVNTSKCRLLSARPCDAASQKVVNFVIDEVGTWSLTFIKLSNISTVTTVPQTPLMGNAKLNLSKLPQATVYQTYLWFNVIRMLTLTKNKRNRRRQQTHFFWAVAVYRPNP
jgi:hypothetical protein